MKKLGVCGFVLVAVGLMSCNTCKGKKEPSIPTAPAVEHAPPPTQVPVSPIPRQPEPQEKVSVGVPMSYWGLDRKAYTVIRVKTVRLGQTSAREENPRELKPFSYAALEMTGKNPGDVEQVKKAIDKITTILRERKIFTMAQPIVVQPIGEFMDEVVWFVGIPLAEGQTVEDPLVLKKVRSEKAFVKRFTMKDHSLKEGMDLVAVIGEKPSTIAINESIRNGFVPESVILRFVNYRDHGFGHDDLVFEEMVPCRDPETPEEKARLERERRKL